MVLASCLVFPELIKSWRIGTYKLSLVTFVNNEETYNCVNPCPAYEYFLSKK